MMLNIRSTKGGVGVWKRDGGNRMDVRDGKRWCGGLRAAKRCGLYQQC